MNRFTIIERNNCVLVEGALPPKWITAIASTMPKKAVVSPDLARMLGANFAFGMASDIDALIATIKPQAEAQAVRQHSDKGLSDAAVRWLASGERGMSSAAMFTKLTGVKATDDPEAHPRDPADVRRCWLLLDQCPELKPLFPKMAEVSTQWAGLVRDWDAIILTLYEEWISIRDPKRSASAPRTYNLIKIALGEK